MSRKPPITSVELDFDLAWVNRVLEVVWLYRVNRQNWIPCGCLAESQMPKTNSVADRQTALIAIGKCLGVAIAADQIRCAKSLAFWGPDDEEHA